MPDDMIPLTLQRNLKVTLAELLARDQPYPLACCLLFRAGPGLGDPLAEYVDMSFAWLDMLTGDDCAVLLPTARRMDSANLPERDVDRLLLDTIRHLDLSIDAIPCAVLFVPARGHADRLVLRLARYVPQRADGYQSADVQDAMHALIEGIRRATHEHERTRLIALRRELEHAHARAFPHDSAPTLEWPAPVSAAASVLAALASAAGIALGSQPG